MPEDTVALSELRATPIDFEAAFSPKEDVRQKWFDNFKPPEITLTPGSLLMQKLGEGGWGKVYKYDINGKPYAVKFAKRQIEGRVKLWGETREMLVKQDFIGLMVAHGARPDVFAKPHGVVRTPGGEVVGMVMDFIEGCEELYSFMIIDGHGVQMDIRHRPGNVLRPNFFWKLRDAINEVTNLGIRITDLNHFNILVDKNMSPRMVDVQYRVKYNPRDEPELRHDTSVVSMNNKIDKLTELCFDASYDEFQHTS